MKLLAFFESIIVAISFFIGSVFNLPDDNVQKIIDNNNGLIYGVCHPNEKYEMLEDAGLEWVRFDIPCPYDSQGNIRNEYKSFKQRCKGYKDNGFKVMAITPYPRDLISGMNFNPMDDLDRLKDIAVFLYDDLQGYADGFQITNEMGLVESMAPLTIEQAAIYIGLQLEAIYEIKSEDFIIGYNSADLIQVSKQLHKLMKPYLKYCDYVGIDLYTGNTGAAKADAYCKKVKELYRMTHKPVIIMEFGFLSEGMPKTDEEKNDILASYGYSSEAEARADGQNFIDRLPSQFQMRLQEEFPNEKANWSNIVFDKLSGHFYGETSSETLENIPHSPEGQAQYYKRVIEELKTSNLLAGMFIYCCQDMKTCFYCGQDSCPYETRWGLFYLDGSPKPSYYAVREMLTGKKDTDV